MVQCMYCLVTGHKAGFLTQNGFYRHTPPRTNLRVKECALYTELLLTESLPLIHRPTYLKITHDQLLSTVVITVVRSLIQRQNYETSFQRKKLRNWKLGKYNSCYGNYMYSGPSLSGHSQQRPPSLMWPQTFGATTMNAFTSPSHQRPPL